MTVSVIIPAYNAAAWIDDAIASALAQRHRPLEVIVVDDGSTDDTAARVMALVEREPRVRLLRTETNSGRPAVARNAGLAAALGEYVAFLDADDLWNPWKLSDQVGVMSRHADLLFVYSMLESFGYRHRLDVAFGVMPLPFKAAVSRAVLERENVIACSSVLARRAAIAAAGGFDEDPGLAAVEDYDLWLRLASRGPIAFIPRIHGRYRAGAGISARTDMVARCEYLWARHRIRPGESAFRSRGPAGLVVRAIAHDLSRALVRIGERVQRYARPGHVPMIRTMPAS
ncbi:MAG: glycosyltransferase family 2 protein [Vicinamibacterales bacterium]